MKFYRLALTALLLPITASVFAQDFDDIYYNPKTDKKQVTKTVHKESKTLSGDEARKVYYQMTDYAPADTYSDGSSYRNTRSVDEYNRRGFFSVNDSIASQGDSIDIDDSFRYTQRIKRFYNPTIASGDEVVEEYLATPGATVNIYINDPYASPYWSGASSFYYGYPYYGSPYYYPYSYWANWNYYPTWTPGWGWGPSWSFGWGPSWSWGVGPFWGYVPSWGGGHFHPSWGGGHNRPGGGNHAVRPQRPSSGNRPGIGNLNPNMRPSMGGNGGRPGSSSGYRPTQTGRPATSTPNNNGSYNRSGRGDRNNSTNHNSGYNRSNSGSRGSGFGGGSSSGMRSGSGGGRSGGGARGRH